MTTKFMQTLDDEVFADITKIAQGRGITVQQFLRAIVIPEWAKSRGIADKLEAQAIDSLRRKILLRKKREHE